MLMSTAALWHHKNASRRVGLVAFQRPHMQQRAVRGQAAVGKNLINVKFNCLFVSSTRMFVREITISSWRMFCSCYLCVSARHNIFKLPTRCNDVWTLVDARLTIAAAGNIFRFE